MLVPHVHHMTENKKEVFLRFEGSLNLSAYNLDVLILELQAIRKQMKPSLLDRIPCLFKGKKFQTNRKRIE